ncbi:MAG: PAS domain-containing protein [Desulfobacterales bacterium]|nr:PAS domain-containing protein [Desulfobacterales bacterium]
MDRKPINEKLEQIVRNPDLCEKAAERQSSTVQSLQIIIDNMPQYIFWKDRDSVYLGCNEKFARAAGIEKPSDIEGKTDYDLAWKKSESDLFRAFERKVMETNTSEYHIIEPHLRADGKQVWLDTSKMPLRDIDGNVVGILGIYEEITERKKAEIGLQQYQEQLEILVSERTSWLDKANKKLKDQLDFFQKLIDSIPNSIYYKNTDGLYIGCNSAFAERIGKNKEDIIGKTVFDILPKETAEKHYDYDIELFSRTGHQNIEGDVRYADDSIHKVIYNKATYTDSSGNVAGLIGVLSDITDLNKAQESLRKLGIENEALICSISSFLIGVDANGIIITWNKVAEDLFAIGSNMVKGLPFPECGLSWEWDRIKSGISRCIESRNSIRLDDVRFTQKNGKQGFLGITLNPMLLEGTGPVGFLLMGADITKRKQMEIQISQAGKLESIGQLAAGIAHEINTPVQYVGDNLRFLQDSFNSLGKLHGIYSQLIEAVKNGDQTNNIIKDAEKEVQESDLNYLIVEIPTAIKQSMEGVAQVAKIVRSIKDFSHPGGEEKTGVDINRALESTVIVSRNEWKYVAEMETDFDPSLPMVPGHPGELNQVFLNLIINAAHTISDIVKKSPDKKGAIRLTTRNKINWVEIIVSDTGTGIPKDIRSRIFDPFFTTKEVGKGTGQGLAICHSIIVQKHGGSLSFETEEGSGSAFTVRLPTERDVSILKGVE